MYCWRAAGGNTIIYSLSRKEFYSHKQGTQPAPFKAENYADSAGEWIALCFLCVVVECIYLHAYLLFYYKLVTLIIIII